MLIYSNDTTILFIYTHDIDIQSVDQFIYIDIHQIMYIYIYIFIYHNTEMKHIQLDAEYSYYILHIQLI